MGLESIIKEQSEKLKSKEYLEILWGKIQEEEIEDEISFAPAKQDFIYHLPVIPEDFWELCITRLNTDNNETASLNFKDELLTQYFLCLCYWYIHSEESTKVNLLVSECYLHVIGFENNSRFFVNSLYKDVVSKLSEHLIDNVASNALLTVISKLKRFVLKHDLKMDNLQLTLNLLMEVIEYRTVSLRNHLSEEYAESLYIDEEALKCIKYLILKEENDLRLFTLTMYLLSCIRTSRNTSITRQSLHIVQTNLRSLIKDLHSKILLTKYSPLKNSFLHCWTLPTFEHYDVAVNIMNDMNKENYRSIIQKLNTMVVGKHDICKRNLMRLSFAILRNSPVCYSDEKLKVLFFTLIRNIIINFASKCSDVFMDAVDVFTGICQLNKDNLNNIIKDILNASTTDIINSLSFLRRLHSLIDIKWKQKNHNKNICHILCFLIMNNIDVDKIYYIEILQILSAEASPFDLKPCLQTLSNSYVFTKQQEQESLSYAIFNVLYKLAMHPAATSSEFVKHMYSAMVNPIKMNGKQVSEFFITPLISDNHNFNEFFKKCDALSLIRADHIKKLISNTENETNMKLLCAVLEFNDYKEFIPLTDYIMDHFDTVANDRNSKYLFYALNKILSRRLRCMNSSFSGDRIEQLRKLIEMFVMNQKFPLKTVSNTLALLQTLNEITNTELSSDVYKMYDYSLVQTLSDPYSSNNLKAIIYASELMLFSNYVPSETACKKLIEVLDSFSSNNLTSEQEQKYEVWMFCLILQTTIGIQLKNSLESTLKYLKTGIRSKNVIVKLLSIRLMYDISNIIVRNFDTLIEIMFNEIIGDSLIIRKICAEYIEKLVRDEYLKLNTSQYLKFVCLLREQSTGMSDYMQKLLSENFIISHQAIIAKNFVYVLVHFNQYKKHPVVVVDKKVLAAVEKTNQTILNKEQTYQFLFNPLTKSAQFNILKELSVFIIDAVVEGKLKQDVGYWEMINDVILITKIIASEHQNNSDDESYYSKTINIIQKHIVDKNKQYSEKPKYIEFHTEVRHVTQSLLSLLFFNESNHILKHIKTPLFDCLVHWTNYLQPDIIHLVHEENSKRIKMLYSKFINLYKTDMKNNVGTSTSARENKNIASTSGSRSLTSISNVSGHHFSLGNSRYL